MHPSGLGEVECLTSICLGSDTKGYKLETSFRQLIRAGSVEIPTEGKMALHCIEPIYQTPDFSSVQSKYNSKTIHKTILSFLSLPFNKYLLINIKETVQDIT